MKVGVPDVPIAQGPVGMYAKPEGPVEEYGFRVCLPSFSLFAALV